MPESELPERLPAGFEPTIEALRPVTASFVDAGHDLYLVGGIVRDTLLGLGDAVDVDCTTAARPETIKGLLEPLADALWTQGERFGTIGARFAGLDLEITTYRAERYDPDSRKPVVDFGDELRADLARRDFTINAMAVSLVDRRLHDPFGGRSDLSSRLLRTPLDPSVSFGDDPLRMLRAARFLPRFTLTAGDDLVEAARRYADRLGIVSLERVHDEIERLLAVADPTTGFDFLVDTGLLRHVLGFEPPADRRRLAFATAATTEGVRRRRIGLLAPFGIDDARRILARLKYSTEDRDDTIRGIGLMERIGDGEVTDAAIRQLVVDARGDHSLLEDAFAVCEARSAIEPDSGHPRALRDRWADLAATEDLDALDSPLDGQTVMRVLGLPEGPAVGQAMAHLRRLRIENGPMSVDDAITALRAWFGEPDGQSVNRPRRTDPRGAG